MSRTGHPEERALLAAIHAEPSDDTPRLVYADWLQEHDQPESAEFIRLQIACHNLWQEGPTNSPRPETSRERALLRRHREEWGKPFLKSQRFCYFERGLPFVMLTCLPDRYRARVARAHRFGSPRQCVKLWFRAGEERHAAWVTRHPLIGRVHAISIGADREPGDGATRPPGVFRPLLEALVDCPRLPALQAVTILGPEDVPGLVELARHTLGSTVTVKAWGS